MKRRHAFDDASVRIPADVGKGALHQIIGPWWLELLESELPDFRYAILHADLETVLRRTSERAKTSQAAYGGLWPVAEKANSTSASYPKRTPIEGVAVSPVLFNESHIRHRLAGLPR
jgi:hypothetical protein